MASAKKRIYKVTMGENEHLVNAISMSQAVNHIAKSAVRAEVATTMDVAVLVRAGHEVEEAGAEVDPVQLSIPV